MKEFKETYNFKDIMLVPQYSEIKSRHDVDTSTQLGPYTFKIPIISANMNTITESEMAIAMDKLGGLGIIHRFNSIEQQYEEAKKVRKYKNEATVAIALGINDLKDRAKKLTSTSNILVLDIAHGHNKRAIEAVKYLKNEYKYHYLIAGNVATNGAAMDLIAAGADCVKIGIGPGHVCRTRKVTGCGVPQLTAILDCSSPDYSTIADGGIECSGDIVKALAGGATMVMLGYLLAGTKETPGPEYVKDDGQRFKFYQGMSSFEANGRLDIASEGIRQEVPFKGSLNTVVNNLVMGLKSGMSYCGAKNLNELVTKAEFIRVYN